MAKRVPQNMPQPLDDADDAGAPVRGMETTAVAVLERDDRGDLPQLPLTEKEIQARAAARRRRQRPEGLAPVPVPTQDYQPLTEADLKARALQRIEAARERKLELQTRPTTHKKFRVVLQHPDWFASPIEFIAEGKDTPEEALKMITDALVQSLYVSGEA